MLTQISTKSTMTFNLIVASPLAEPICASSRDYGFDFNEEEIARELIAPLPASLADQPISEVEADEFEKVFQYFFS